MADAIKLAERIGPALTAEDKRTLTAALVNRRSSGKVLDEEAVKSLVDFFFGIPKRRGE
jgi:hypothetical protein